MMFIRNRSIEIRPPFSSAGLTVNYIVYDESRNIHSSGTASELGTGGVYYTSFTPDNQGDWTVFMYCLTTGEKHTFNYALRDVTSTGSGTYYIEVADGTTEQTVITISKAGSYSLSYYMDLNTLITNSEGGTVTSRLYNRIDGSNYRIIAEWDFAVGVNTEHPSVEVNMLKGYSYLSIQLSSAVTAQRACPFKILIEDIGG